MPRRIKIWVVTALYPTKAEPYRGAAIWSTVQELSSYGDLEAYCPLARYPAWLAPRNFPYLPHQAETEGYGIASQTIEYFAIPGVTRSLNGQVLYRKLRKAVPANAPDVILSFYIYPEAYAAVLLGEELGIPVVVSSRGSDLRKIDASPFVRKMTGSALQKAAAVLCVSSDLAEIARRLGAPAQNVHVIRNGVDGGVFFATDQQTARAALPMEINGRLVLFVGRLSALKGVPHLLQAMALMKDRRSETWQLALVGEGSLEPALRQQTRDLGIQENVKFVGPQSARQIAAWMNASDFLCLPSESEGCPNVVVEALSCGTPVVANAVGGIPELVNDLSAVLMPNNSPEAIAGALEKAHKRSWDRGQIARENLRTWQHVGRETYQVCESVVRTWAPALAQVAEASYGTRG